MQWHREKPCHLAEGVPPAMGGQNLMLAATVLVLNRKLTNISHKLEYFV